MFQTFQKSHLKFIGMCGTNQQGCWKKRFGIMGICIFQKNISPTKHLQGVKKY
jgi:hypothetical protein